MTTITLAQYDKMVDDAIVQLGGYGVKHVLQKAIAIVEKAIAGKGVVNG